MPPCHPSTPPHASTNLIKHVAIGVVVIHCPVHTGHVHTPKVSRLNSLTCRRHTPKRRTRKKKRGRRVRVECVQTRVAWKHEPWINLGFGLNAVFFKCDWNMHAFLAGDDLTSLHLPLHNRWEIIAASFSPGPAIHALLFPRMDQYHGTHEGGEIGSSQKRGCKRT